MPGGFSGDDGSWRAASEKLGWAGQTEAFRLPRAFHRWCLGIKIRTRRDVHVAKLLAVWFAQRPFHLSHVLGSASANFNKDSSSHSESVPMIRNLANG